MSMVEFQEDMRYEEDMRDIEDCIEKLADHSKDETVRDFIKCFRKCGPNTHLIRELIERRKGCQPEEGEMFEEIIDLLLCHTPSF